MGKQKYLIDTNSLIDYLGMKLPEKGMLFLNEVVDLIPYFSVISKNGSTTNFVKTLYP